MMDINTIVELVKARIGIRSIVRDTYITAIAEGVVDELQDVQGIALDKDSSHQLMFIVDLATWRYQNRDSSGAMPRHLQFRLYNLIIANRRDNNDV